MDDWLPEDHLARFIVEVVSMLDLEPIRAAYAGRGSEAYDPSVLLSLLFYGYATRTFSSRRIEAATYDSVAFRYIAAGSHPDHDTIASFRKRFLGEINAFFVQILQIAHQMGFRKVGTVSLDGTKVKANASKHRALSYKHAEKLQKQLESEVRLLLRLAEEADATELPPEMDIPGELKRRQDRLKVIAEAKAEIERRAQKRHERDMEAHEEKMAQRKRVEDQRGRKIRGRTPRAPEPEVRDSDQVNLTDEESLIMPLSGGGFEQAYNCQASLDIESGLLLTHQVSQSPVDKRELAHAVEALTALPKGLGRPEALLADAGYFSRPNVELCERNNITPFISFGREQHNLALEDRWRCPPDPETEDPVALMEHRLKTPEGRKLYGRRKATIEPAFGVIKQVMGFRQFLLRGVRAAKCEWSLVCSAFNLKRMHRLYVSA
jgi:transposase